MEARKVGQDKWGKKSGARNVGCEKWSEGKWDEKSGARKVGREKWGEEIGVRKVG